MIVNESSLADLFVGFKDAFNKGFNTVEANWEKVATRVPSTTSEEHYAWLGQFPRLREWVGDRQIKNLSAHSYRVKNKKFESTIAVERDKIEDDSYGVYSPLFQEMGFAAKTHPDELVFNLLADGFAETCYDGQYFFDVDHPVLVNGVETSVSNMQAGSGAPWFLLDARRPLKPLIFQDRRAYELKSMVEPTNEHVWKRDEFQYGVDARANVGFGFWQTALGAKTTLDATAFNAALASMMAFKSDEGRPLGITPNLLVVGPSNRAAAKTVIETQIVGNNSNINFQAVDVLVVPWLA
jgi:phage major head subunit gpT-like protein